MKELGRFEVPVYHFGIIVYKGLPEGKPANQVGLCECCFEQQIVKIHYKQFEPQYIVHEIVHAADAILSSIGADMGTNPSDSEVKAYLIDFIVMRVFNILKKKKCYEWKSV